MKVTVLQENLARGLAIISRAISGRSTLPILANVLIATDNGRLRLSATDLEIGITCRLDAQVKDGGSITVPAKTFTEIVATFPKDGQVHLTLDKGKQALKVDAGSSKSTIKGIDPGDFPPIPTIEGADSVRFSATDLKAAIQKVAFAASIIPR